MRGIDMNIFSLHDKAFILLQWSVAAAAILSSWFLFFRIRYLEKGFEEDRKSVVVQSCVIPLFISLVAIFCFGVVPPQELEQGVHVWWVISVAVAMVLFVALIVTHTRVTQKPAL